MDYSIAIIDSNTLSSIALQRLLWDIFPDVEILRFGTMKDYVSDCNHNFLHYFVNAETLLENVDEFDTLRKETIAISSGPAPILYKAGFKVVDITLPEKDLVREILSFHEEGLARDCGAPTFSRRTEIRQNVSSRLTEREREVLAMMVKGFSNKQIADALEISQPTAIFHRNNVCRKLGTRSLGRLAVFAILSGVVSVEELAG